MTTNIGRGFNALQLGCIARLWHDFRLFVGLSVTLCIVVKRCETGPCC